MGSESTSPRLFGDPCHLYGDLYKYSFGVGSENSQPSINTASSSTSSDGKPLRSMLVTGFGMRNWDSLQRALLDDEQRRQMLLAQYGDKGESCECESLSSLDSSKLFAIKSRSRPIVVTKESDIPHVDSPSLNYLLKLADEMEDEFEGTPQKLPEELGAIEGEAEEEEDLRLTEAMRKAQRYLRTHRIFEFFRFLTAHLVAELPENPLEFLINLLDRCLLYRSGFGDPPLLFEKPHLEQLFYLMDRMRTGFIDMKQYEVGMKTLGICSFDKHPPLSTEGLISQEFFVEEAYECLTDLFVDMIRRRGGPQTPPSLVTPPPTVAEPSIYGGGQ